MAPKPWQIWGIIGNGTTVSRAPAVVELVLNHGWKTNNCLYWYEPLWYGIGKAGPLYGPLYNPLQFSSLFRKPLKAVIMLIFYIKIQLQLLIFTFTSCYSSKIWNLSLKNRLVWNYFYSFHIALHEYFNVPYSVYISMNHLTLFCKTRQSSLACFPIHFALSAYGTNIPIGAVVINIISRETQLQSRHVGN